MLVHGGGCHEKEPANFVILPAARDPRQDLCLARREVHLAVLISCQLFAEGSIPDGREVVLKDADHIGVTSRLASGSSFALEEST